MLGIKNVTPDFRYASMMVLHDAQLFIGDRGQLVHSCWPTHSTIIVSLDGKRPEQLLRDLAVFVVGKLLEHLVGVVGDCQLHSAAELVMAKVEFLAIGVIVLPE